MEADQLQDAELDAAVATAMDKHPQLLPDVKGVLHCMVPYPQDCAPDAMVAFRPSRGSAAAWEVLEWLRRPDAAYWVSLETSPSHPSHCVITHGDCLETHGHGPTDAIALCRAVVALGEAG